VRLVPEREYPDSEVAEGIVQMPAEALLELVHRVQEQRAQEA
jgi:hypothetical protein